MKRYSARRRARLAVLISGRGSNMLALERACRAEDFPARIALVLADDPQAPGLARARQRDLATAAVDRRAFKDDRPGFEAAMQARLDAAKVEIVCLAGFMRILSEDFIERWRDRLVNIHPSLLPSFPGLGTHARALAAGVKIHGATVHLARAEVDSGPILAQAAVPVLGDDDAEALAARVLRQEHRLYAHALKIWLTGALRVDGERVVADAEGAPRSLISPPRRR